MKKRGKIFDPARLQKKRRNRIILLSFLAVLIGVRIALPFIIKNQLVKAINKVEGYHCTLEDVDLHLFRGAMILKEFDLRMTSNEVEKPFVYCKNADISVEWKQIFNGAIVSEIILDDLRLYFSDSKDEDKKQEGGVSWVQPIIDFIPLKINRFEINGGMIEFENLTSAPPVNLKMTDLYLLAENLTNSQDDKKALPSKLKITSKVLNKGDLTLKGDLNILKELPDMDLNLDIQNVDLTELNAFTTAYANFDFERGDFAVAAEFAMLNGETKGYLKPILNDVKVLSFKHDKPALNTLWQAVVGLTFNVTKNFPKDRTGTKVPISGRYDQPDIDVWQTVVNILRNAIIKAYDPEIDGTISLGSVGKDEADQTFWDKLKDVFTTDKQEKAERKERRKNR
ncbi:MAG: DUF748 domain-containing protein [Crocinitomicaceae bacterium]|nr:DUF748 domain-containing protein [Crocinitomicaceae bacterium]